jgi:CDP-4-dehydro-6-deoxyglucose reductase/ferredoxin-NAD(P)+ reductase (naphthalene dioxygenase ferredoxin-specific)
MSPRVAAPPPDETADHPVWQLIGRVSELADSTHDIKRLRLAIERGGSFAFSAGQYAALGFPGQAPRDYSMASRPDEPMLEFHIRRTTGGAASQYVAHRLRLGDLVTVEGPYGSCWLRQQHRGPILAIAGGSGLAPIKSIVETALAHGMTQPIFLYFGARAERDLYLVAHFEDLAGRHRNLRFVPVLSDPEPADTGRRRGLLHDAVATDFAALAGAKAYLAGPPIMVEAVVAILVSRGVAPQDIHADAFYSEAEKQALEAAP